jgi:hypothetical protein
VLPYGGRLAIKRRVRPVRSKPMLVKSVRGRRSRMKRIETIWQNIRQNLDIYITVAISVVTAILGLLGIVDQAIISAAVLATLALVSTSMLQNRHQASSLRDAVSQLQSTSRLIEPFLGRELTSYSSQNEYLSTAQKAFFWGLTFERMIPHLRYTLEHRLQSGLEARFLVLKPESSAVRMAAFRDPYQDESRINTVLHTALSDLRALAKKATEPANLEVRFVDYLPPWTMVAFDPHLPNGQMFVSLVPFRSPNENRPTFKLKAVRDKEWIRIFREQFDKLWTEAEPVDLSESKK